MSTKIKVYQFRRGRLVFPHCFLSIVGDGFKTEGEEKKEGGEENKGTLEGWEEPLLSSVPSAFPFPSFLALAVRS